MRRDDKVPDEIETNLICSGSSLTASSKARKKVLFAIPEEDKGSDLKALITKANVLRGRALQTAQDIDLCLETKQNRDGEKLTILMCTDMQKTGTDLMNELNNVTKMIKPFVVKIKTEQ